MPGWARNALSLAAVLCLAAAYRVAWRAPAAGTFHDDGVYLVTAKALAERGEYRIISLPSEVAQTKYPVFFPWALACVWKLNPAFPQNLPWLKLVPLAFGLLWLGLSYRLMREQGSSGAAGVVLLAAASPWVVYVSTALLSETMFAAACTACLLFLHRADRGAGWRTVAAAALFAAAAFHVRTLGLAFWAAGPAILIWRGRWRHAALFLGLTLALCSPWIVWQMSQAGGVPSVDAYYSRENYQGWNILLNFPFSQKIHILGQNLLMAVLSPGMLAGVPNGGAWVLPSLAFGLSLCAAVFRMGVTPTTAFVAVYLAVVVCWAWPPPRFVVPLLPLIYWGGREWLAGQSRRVRRGLAAVIVLGAAAGLIHSSQRTVLLGDAMPSLRADDAWQPIATLLAEIERETPGDAVIASNLDPVVYLYTGRKAVRGFAAQPYPLIYSPGPEAIGTMSRFLDNLRAQKVRYILATPNSAFLEGPYLEHLLASISERYPKVLTPINHGTRHSHRLYQISWEVLEQSSSSISSHPKQP